MQEYWSLCSWNPVGSNHWCSSPPVESKLVLSSIENRKWSIDPVWFWDSYMRFATTELPIFLKWVEIATNVKVVVGSRRPGRDLGSNIEISVCRSTYADLRRTWCFRLCFINWLRVGKIAVVMILWHIGICNMICHDMNSNILPPLNSKSAYCTIRD